MFWSGLERSGFCQNWPCLGKLQQKTIATKQYLCSEGGKKGIFVDTICLGKMSFLDFTTKNTTKRGGFNGHRGKPTIYFFKWAFLEGASERVIYFL